MKLKRETLWVLSSVVVAATVQFLMLVAIARIGSPNVVGQLAIINVVLSLAMIIQDMGLSSYFIHRQQLSSAERSSLFGINVVFGAVASILVLATSLPIGLIYESPEITQGLQLISFNFFIIGIGAQYQASYIKYQLNEILCKIEIFSKVLLVVVFFTLWTQSTSILTVYLIAVLVSVVVKVVLMICFAPIGWHPTAKPDRNIIKSAVHFGGFQLGSQVINQLRVQADQLIIGKTLGTEVLGIYSVAKELILQPNRLISPLLTRIALPLFASTQDDLELTSIQFEKASRMVLLFNTSLFITGTVGIYFLLPVFFGEKFSGSIDVFCILLIVGMLRPFGSLLGVLSQSLGRSDLEFQWNMVAAVVSVSALVSASFFTSLTVYACTMAALQLCLTCGAALFFSKRLLSINLRVFYYQVSLITLLYGAVFAIVIVF